MLAGEMDSRQYCTGLLAVVAEFERELIRERVRAGIKNAKANGKELGRPRRVFNRQRAVELGVGQGTVVRAVAALTTT